MGITRTFDKRLSSREKVFQLWREGRRIGERELFLYFTIDFGVKNL
jgi:hypothetical protein